MVISTEIVNICFTDTLYISFSWLLKFFCCLSDQQCQGFKWLVLWPATSDLVGYSLGSTSLLKCCCINVLH